MYRICLGSCHPARALAISCIQSANDISQPNVGSGADAHPPGPEPEAEVDQAARSRRRLHQNPKTKPKPRTFRQGWLDTWHWMKLGERWMEELGDVGKR